MAYTLPASHTANPAIDYASGRPISNSNMSDLMVGNYHWLIANHLGHVVTQTFGPGTGYLEGASTSYVIRAVWRREILADFPNLTCRIRYQNTSGSDDGSVRLAMQSDTGTYYVEGTLTASTAQWGYVDVTLPVDVTQDRDTIQLEVKNGATGVCRIHSISVWPAALASMADAITPSGCARIDDSMVAQDAPYTTYLVGEVIDGLGTLRSTRQDTLISYSDDATGSPIYQSRAGTYDLVLRVPFSVTDGQESIRWAMHCYQDGTGGTIQLRTGYMRDVLETAEEITVASSATTWTPDYSGSELDSSGATELVCSENYNGGQDEIEVSIKTTTLDAYVMSFCAWFGPVV